MLMTPPAVSIPTYDVSERTGRQGRSMGLTSREGGDIEEEEVLGLLRRVSREDGGLDGSTVGNGLIGVDGLVGLL